MTLRERPAIAVAIAGLVLGFVCGGIANYFALRLLLRGVEWHTVLFTDGALAALLVVRAAKAWRRGFGLAPGVLFGIALAIVACWALLFLVVGI